MRALAILIVAAALLFGAYELYVKKMPVTDARTAPAQAVTLTGVKNDLLQIAQAERSNIALNSHCASLDELISSGSLQMTHSERDGYSYQVNCSDADFQVVARHPSTPQSTATGYPTLSIDSALQIQELSAR